jgi:3-hydroxyisobutyrate dehydrogenase-like beta-hydroxyacid dehydrogenase
MSDEKIGFIGTGKMGAPMTRRLLAAGYGVSIFDLDRSAMAPLQAEGATVMGSPQEVASVAEIVCASLPSPEALKQTVLGEGGILQGSVVKTLVDFSTTGPRVAEEIAGLLARRDIVTLDAPVSGGIAGAIHGKLAVMVSGPRAAYDSLRPFLENFGRLFFISETPGQAQTMKLVNNLLNAAAMAASAEAVVMGVKAGLAPGTMIDIINVSSGRNSAIQDKFPRAVLPRSFDFGFATGLSFKDVALCLEEATALGVPMIVGSAVRQLLSITNAQFGPASDFTSMVRTVEGWAGVEVRG